MPVEFRHPFPAAELEAWSRALTTTFFGDPAHLADRVAIRARRWVPERAWSAWDDGRVVGTLETLERKLTVPGPKGTTAQLSTDALTAVTVAATHRRRGLLTRMLTDSLAAAAERGDPTAILFAAEWPIYGRYGYAPATRHAKYRLQPRQRGCALRGRGTLPVRQLTDDHAAEHAPAVFDAARLQRPGQIDRGPLWWDIEFGLHGMPVPPWRKAPPTRIACDGGYLSWTAGEEDAAGYAALEVGELHAATDEAYVALWDYLLNIDLAASITVRNRPPDEALRFLLVDGRALETVHVEDGLWLRLLDVPAALGGRAYATSDRLVLRVLDDAPGAYAAGGWALDASPDGATCTHSDAEPDLVLDQRALAAAYFGEYTLAAQGIASAPARRLDALLAAPLAAWCATDF